MRMMIAFTAALLSAVVVSSPAMAKIGLLVNSKDKDYCDLECKEKQRAVVCSEIRTKLEYQIEHPGPGALQKQLILMRLATEQCNERLLFFDVLDIKPPKYLLD